MKTKKTKLIFHLPRFTFYLLLTLLIVSCGTNDPPPPGNGNGKEEKVILTVDDTSPTEVWLEVTTENIVLPKKTTLIRNGDTVQTFTLTKEDTILYKDSLLPSQSFNYKAVIGETESEAVTAITMDTTSHNFSWEVFEFGEHGNSILRDVAIIDENNIWAVGAVYLNDSTGSNDSKLYNAIHWDGNQWKVQRITTNFRGNLITLQLEGVIAFSSNDIWVVGSLPIYGDGQNWEIIDVREITNSDLSLSKVWGISSNDIYFVGRGGSIAYYNGTSWNKVESGTELTLTNVYGTGSNKVYVSGVQISESKGILLKGNSTGFSVVKNSGIISESELFDKLYGELAAVWVDEKGTIYTGGNILYWNRRGQWNYVTNLPENFLGGNPGVYYSGFIFSISGNRSNDYVITGDRNTLKHYNGINWQQLGMEYSPTSPIDWYAVEQKENLIVAVGVIGNKAIIIKLRR